MWLLYCWKKEIKIYRFLFKQNIDLKTNNKNIYNSVLNNYWKKSDIQLYIY